MRRRDFIGGFAGIVAWPLTVCAQVSGLRHIGLLMGGRGESDPEGQARLGVIKERFQELGWEEGRNLRLTSRWAASGMARIEALAQELVQLAPDVILANATPAIAALSRTTRSIPIVFAQIVDPVGLGYVESLARPGGNITGFTFVDLELVAKWP